MATYNDKLKSFVSGLSDFWLLYFQDIDQLEAFYEGSEILIGQAYLDLMSLLLNNSVQDLALFNKEFFKLLLVAESDVRYQEGAATGTGRYIYALPDNVVYARHLHNKILDVTASLDKDADYLVNSETRDLEFRFDPTNAYYERSFGGHNGKLRVRSRLTPGKDIRISLENTGTKTTVTQNELDITVQFAPTTTAAAVVSALNTHVTSGGTVFAETLGDGTGVAPSTVGLVPLLRAVSNSLDGFASRQVEKKFSGKFIDAEAMHWAAAGVRKGDTLRVLTNTAEIVPAEATIVLVRDDALYLDTEQPLLAHSSVEYAVVRGASHMVSTSEAFPSSGAIVQSGLDGVVLADDRRFQSVTSVFAPAHVGDVLEFTSANNSGVYRILQVLSPQEVTLAATSLVDEIDVSWVLRSVVPAADMGNDGVVLNLGEGLSRFTAASAFFGTDVPGAVLRILVGTATRTLSVVSVESPTSVIVEQPYVISDAGGYSWGMASIRTATQAVIFSPPLGWLIPGSVSVSARRLLDGSPVTEGRDYSVVADTGHIAPRTVWQTSASNTVSYGYRMSVVENSTAIQSGSTGLITPGEPAEFTDPTADFRVGHVGYALRVSGSQLPGDYEIESVVDSTHVTLATTNSVSVPATLTAVGPVPWELFRRGYLSTDDAVEQVAQIAFWAPDALVDRFHLYNTYGYLLGRMERSSESYRTLIRGIFQLFMLGPTLERLESAINTVAGLSVIRDNGEILLSYSSGAEEEGTGGEFSFERRTFADPAGITATAASAGYIFALSGPNSGQLFKVVSRVDDYTVLLDRAPVTDSLVEWEFTLSAEQRVRTTHQEYVFSRDIPLRDAVTDPTNVGTKIFSAFEVLTSVFRVTDYLEDPAWFNTARIPEELMPLESAERRQSSTALFENIVRPADSVHIGDPGFILGADSEGFVPPSQIIRSSSPPVLDGILVGDAHYPVSNLVQFASPTGAFTSADVGNTLIVFPGTSQEQGHRILGVLDTTTVEVEAFQDIEDATAVGWQVVSSPLALRHKTAFVVLNQYLKYHLFSVDFNALLPQISSQILEDLGELVQTSKPAYTYVFVTPAALFYETLQISEALGLRPQLELGGSVGLAIASNENKLKVGPSWSIGTWFRYAENTGTFSAPAVEITDALGPEDAGYRHYITKAVLDPALYTAGGIPIDVAAPAYSATPSKSGNANLTLTNTGGVTTATVATTSDEFNAAFILGTLAVSRSVLGNGGEYRIGAVLDGQTVVLDAPGVVDESGLDWSVLHSGGLQGALRIDAGGGATFTDKAGLYTFSAADVGNYIRLPYPGYLENQAFRVEAEVTSHRVSLDSLNFIDPQEGDPPIAAYVSSGVLSVTPGDVIFSASMASGRHYVYFVGGPNDLESLPITRYISASEVYVAGALDVASTGVRIQRLVSPLVVPEVADWQCVAEQISSHYNTVDLSGAPTADPHPAVPYTTYGVREPADPSTAVFDDTAGDTLYSIGMPHPRQPRGKTRTGLDVDLREEPLEITRT